MQLVTLQKTDATTEKVKKYIYKKQYWIDKVSDQEGSGPPSGSAPDCLPFDVECFPVKVYKYFHIYTVEELKEFCSFANVEYAKLLEHGSTRFSTLGPAIDRIILIYAGLRSYFMSYSVKTNIWRSMLFVVVNVRLMSDSGFPGYHHSKTSRKNVSYRSCPRNQLVKLKTAR